MQRKFISNTCLSAALVALSFSPVLAGEATPKQSLINPAVAKSSNLHQRLVWLAAGNKYAAYNQCYNDCMYYAGGRGQYATTFSDQFRCKARCKHLWPKN